MISGIYTAYLENINDEKMKENKYEITLPAIDAFNLYEFEVTRKSPVLLLKVGDRWYIRLDDSLYNKIRHLGELQNFKSFVVWNNINSFYLCWMLRQDVKPATVIEFLKGIKKAEWKDKKCKIEVSYPKI